MLQKVNIINDRSLRLLFFSVFDAQFTSEKVEKEIEYFESEYGKSFERTYGWAWLLKLQVGIYLSIHTIIEVLIKI